MRRYRGFGVGLLLLTLTVGCSGGSSPSTGQDQDEGPAQAESFTIALSQSVWSPAYAFMTVAEDQGYFKEEDLAVDFALLNGSTVAATQVAQGGADVATAGPAAVIIGSQPSKNMELEYFYNLYRRSIFGLYVPEDSPIRSLEDLKGARIASPSLSAIGVSIAKANLRTVGVEPKDVTYVAYGSIPQAILAVKKGDIDALASDDSTFNAFANAGVAMRWIPTPDTSHFPENGLVARKKDVAERPEAYERLGRAIAKATVFATANPTRAIEILFEHHPDVVPAGKSRDVAIKEASRVLEGRLERMTLETGEKWGEYPSGAIEGYAAFLKDAGLVTEDVDAASLYTNDFVLKFNEFDASAIRTAAKG